MKRKKVNLLEFMFGIYYKTYDTDKMFSTAVCDLPIIYFTLSTVSRFHIRWSITISLSMRPVGGCPVGGCPCYAALSDRRFTGTSCRGVGLVSRSARYRIY